MFAVKTYYETWRHKGYLGYGFRIEKRLLRLEKREKVRGTRYKFKS